MHAENRYTATNTFITIILRKYLKRAVLFNTTSNRIKQMKLTEPDKETKIIF